MTEAAFVYVLPIHVITGTKMMVLEYYVFHGEMPVLKALKVMAVAAKTVFLSQILAPQTTKTMVLAQIVFTIQQPVLMDTETMEEMESDALLKVNPVMKDIKMMVLPNV